MKIKNTPRIILEKIAQRFRNRTFSLTFFSLAIILFQIIYILLRFSFLNTDIPLWYTKSWGDYWLAPKSMIYTIPAVSFGIFLFGLGLIVINKFYIKYYYELIWSSVVFCLSFLSYSLIKIIHSSSTPFDSLVNPNILPLAIPFMVALFLTYFILPYFIEFAQNNKLITIPSVHEHPGMVLSSPSARGGGVVYGFIILFIAVLFIGITKNFSGFYLSLLMISFLGIIDDYQNTHPLSSFKVFENPFLRLFLLFLSVLPTVLSGLVISEISNPFGNILILKNIHPLLPAVLTIVWIVWVMNVMSWSNGIDGQYSGIVGISSLAIVFLALRFNPLEPIHLQVATLAAISAGSALGFTKYNWHPSKIMWGFGAMSAGLLISVLSIAISGKIVASILIILVPFMDAIVTVMRRIIQKKNPLTGDRGHLHHLLLERGWSPKKIAKFYWFSTAFFGLVGLMTPERYSIQAAMMVIGIVAFMIILLNLRSKANNHQQPLFEK
jgi:UDP-GlcNAc:undecaprenyl-phosphate GlcNAc-1-phosphate transferase